VKAFDEVLMDEYKDKVITFIDHSLNSGEDPSQSGPRRSGRLYLAKAERISIPNEKFIALHATVGHILYLGGGGQILEALLEKFYPTSRGTAQATWDGLALKISMMNL
jgi:hypothetical protein